MRLTSDDQEQRDLGSAWAELTVNEARELLESLLAYFEESGNVDQRGWHTHIGGPDGPELTVSIVD